FLFLEHRTDRLVDVVWHVRVAEQRDRFGPGKRGALALGEERRLAPGAERVDALLGLAGCPRIFRVHVDAVGARVDLRGANLHELEQRRFEPTLADLRRQLAHGAVERRVRVFGGVDTWCHFHYSLV